jgi:hypothetical protein
MADVTHDPAAQAGSHLHHHGNSVAAWTAVGVMLVGVLLMCVAVVALTAWLFVVGVVVVALGAVTGKVLSAMGFGVSGKPGA